MLEGSAREVCVGRTQDFRQPSRAEASPFLRLKCEERKSTWLHAHHSGEGWNSAEWVFLFQINFHLCLTSVFGTVPCLWSRHPGHVNVVRTIQVLWKPLPHRGAPEMGGFRLLSCAFTVFVYSPQQGTVIGTGSGKQWLRVGLS